MANEQTLWSGDILTRQRTMPFFRLTRNFLSSKLAGWILSRIAPGLSSPGFPPVPPLVFSNLDVSARARCSSGCLPPALPRAASRVIRARCIIARTQNMHHLLEGSRPELAGLMPFGPSPAPDRGVSAGGVSRIGAEEADTPSIDQTRRKEADGAAEGVKRVPEGIRAVGSKGKGKRKAKGQGNEAPGGADGGDLGGLDREETQRLGLYAAFLLPLAEEQGSTKKAKKVMAIPGGRAAVGRGS